MEKLENKKLDTMSEYDIEEISKAVSSLSYMLGDSEEKHYAETYEVENPNDIPTDELKEHAYKYIRVLVDNLGG